MLLNELPRLTYALALMAVDNGAHLQLKAEIPDKWVAVASMAEIELGKLDENQIETLVIGEETEQEKLKTNCLYADKLLLDAFDGDLGELFFSQIKTGLEYLEVEEAARRAREALAKDADSRRAAQPWHPISDPVDLKHLGKLGEELNEAGSAVNRCIIQGIDEAEPITGKVNRRWLQEELADVQANIELVVERFSLDREAMARRAERKKAMLRSWHAMA